MDKPKVLVFITSFHPFIGGAEIAIQEVSRRLSSELDFFIVTARFRRDLPKKEISPEGTIIRLGFGTRFDKWLLPFLAPFYYRDETSIVWGVDISQGSLAAALFKLFNPKTRFILNVQYGYGEERLASGRFGVIGMAFRFMLNQADYVTAISNHLLGVVRSYGYKGPAEVIYNGVDVGKFRIKNQELRIKKEKVVITTSRLIPKNGIDTLIYAIAEVKKIITDIQCFIIGDGSERKNLELQTANCKLQANIKFFGSVSYEEIPRYLHQADIFVRPSRSEGMGNSFVEALAAGIPIIGTSVGGITDIIEDRKTGLFAAVDNPDDLAVKIIAMLQDKEMGRAMVENAQPMIQERFSWDVIALQYKKVFEKVFPSNPTLHNILIATPLYPPDIGGPATYSKILYDELPRYGFNIQVLSFGEVRNLPKIIRHILYFFKVLRRGWRSDVIFAQDPVSVGFPAMLASKILRKPFLIKVVGDYAWEQYQITYSIKRKAFITLEEFQKSNFDFLTEIRRIIQKFVVKNARKIIVPSYYLKGIVSQWGINPVRNSHGALNPVFVKTTDQHSSLRQAAGHPASNGVNEKRILVIYNSFETPNISVSREEVRKIMGLDGTILISSGRLVPWKGFGVLIELMPDILKKIPDARLIIIGDGPDKKNHELRIKDYGLENKVFLVGKLSHENFLQNLRASDVFILNTGYEGFSHILLEAMTMGVPVVTTRVGGNPEIIQDRINGILVEYNNREELKDALEDVIKDKELKTRLVDNAKSRLLNFSKEKMIKNTIDLLCNNKSTAI